MEAFTNSPNKIYVNVQQKFKLHSSNLSLVQVAWKLDMLQHLQSVEWRLEIH